MAVFKAYMKIARKNIWMILLYLGIFFCVTILFQRFVPEGAEGYTAESVPVGIVDEDGGEAAESLINYIGRTNETILLEDDRESLQEDLFYRNVGYIVRIPEGFMEKCILGEEKIEAVTVPGTYAGYYVDQQVNSYMVYARSYAAAGFTETEIASAMAHRDKAEVTLVDFSGNAGQVPAYTFYYRYLPYLLLSVLGYVMGYILMGFRRGSLPQRMRASAVPERRQSVEGLAASLVIALALWGVSAAVSVVMYRQDIFESGKLIWYLLNSLVMMLTALSLAYLVGTLVKSSNALSGIVNIISLGMCFVCGVFVEISYLSAEVRKAAQFLPVYWYETVNTLLTDHRTVAGSIRSEVLSGIGIQIVFAIAFVCVTLAVAKRSRRSS
ncbi:MAG TPA: ABC transporter permease [Candidatus Mediterraneibacter intestinigallinarum]|nr:ABC transporter permease [Candidatus Mediterraneibacter intestinigallinarum]